ncbi:MAG: ASKHA domain-containing protein [bacterium]|nr:ASKHA domain-containing protein [bacterium]
MITVRFEPGGRTTEVPRGTTILAAARQAGLEIVATCGARGRCRSCRVQVVAGAVPPATLADRVQLGDDEVRERFRLACQAEIGEPLTVLVAPILEEVAFQILSDTRATLSAAGFLLDSGVEESPAYGLAFDIGTTTVVGYLVDLPGGTVVATASGLNPQAAFGGDLISRIAFAQENPSNVRTLQTRIVRLLNGQIEELCSEAGINRDAIYKTVIVGNTVMHHLFLGIDSAPLGQAPYTPVVRSSMRLRAHEAGLRLDPQVPVFLLPLVAGFVGADAVGMVLSTRLYTSIEPRIAADIGTNGEVVLGSPDGLIACSAPAGPALEGGQIHCGMRGARGAIDQVQIGRDVAYHAIGGGSPLGVCGSGILDAVAGMLDAGILDASGRLHPDPPVSVPDVLRRRVVSSAGGVPAFALARGDETASGEDIVLTQADVRQVQLAKGAIRSAITMLERISGTPEGRIAELMLAGGFGNYLNVRSAIRIGLIPALPLDRISYVGNAAGLGAQMALVSETERRRADELAERIRHVSLATHPEYQQVFLEAVTFPPPDGMEKGMGE